MNRSSKNSAVPVVGGFILLILFILQGIPFLNGIIISFKEYRVINGLFGSPFTGMRNISGLLADYHFWGALVNTVKLNLLYLAMVLILGYLISMSLMTLNKKTQHVFLTFILIPLFIPGSVMAHLCVTWFQGTNVLMSPPLFPFIYALLMAIKNVGIPTVFMLKTWQITRGHTERTGFERLMAPVAFVLVQLASILNTDMDIMRNLINPLVYQNGDTLDYYMYRTGFMQMQVGTTQSVWLIQVIVHLVLGFVIYYLLRKLMQQKPHFHDTPNDIGQPESERMDERQQVNPMGFIIPVIYAMFLAWFVFKPLLADGFIALVQGVFPVDGRFFISYIQSIVVYGLIALLGVPISVGLAKSANYPGVFGSLTRIILVFFLLAGGMGMHQYLFYRSLGVFNTIFSLILYYFFPLANSLVLAVIIAFKKDNSPDGSHGFSVWKSAFLLSLIQFIMMWNSEQVPMIFIARQNAMPPVLLAGIIARGSGGPIDMAAVMGIDLLVVLLPIILFLVFRRFFTEWILLSFTKGK